MYNMVITVNNTVFYTSKMLRKSILNIITPNTHTKNTWDDEVINLPNGGNYFYNISNLHVIHLKLSVISQFYLDKSEK